ncbi:unnamed protein product [Lepeophtheirus salmonis]|uniref:Sugar transporter SWEET1 n=1 Tax=Lepeophtheirus salmonis TaxID=72036 RepID=A0A7R8CJX3_LEPSM|nr:unnamed protein product [Lepeophtheirus salmonis]CAF2840447.1 unnamed protein product [Lepeophtheirus salmonis]
MIQNEFNLPLVLRKIDSRIYFEVFVSEVLYKKDWIVNLLRIFYSSKMPVVSENMVNYLGNVATLFTIFQFISGVTVCLAIRKGKTTGDRSSITFISGALMCYVWYRYGIAVKDSNILFMKPIKIQCLVSFLIIIFLHGVKTIVESEARITHYTGLLGSVLSIAFAASPLISLRHVFQTKSTEYKQ